MALLMVSKASFGYMRWWTEEATAFFELARDSNCKQFPHYVRCHSILDLSRGYVAALYTKTLALSCSADFGLGFAGVM